MHFRSTHWSMIVYQGPRSVKRRQQGKRMESLSIWHLLIIFLMVWPALHVVISDRSHGGAKFAWFVVAAFFSWLAYLVFLIVTQQLGRASCREMGKR